jgi:hypothetical protein
MTDKDYEQKKRECWEEFCRANPSHNKSIFARKVFAFAFDRAYALGQQFGNSEQVDVEKAAKRFADEIRIPASIPGALVPFINGLAHDAYLQGAQDCLGKQESKRESKQETVIQGWVARHDNGPNDLGLRIYTVKPKRMEGLKRWNGHGEKSTLIDCRLFPDLTWDSEPEQVEIQIKRKKQNL